MVWATPGGTLDNVARAMAEGLTAQLSNPVLVDYKPGAQGMIAAEVVARSPADGYTLLLGTSTYTTLPFLQKTITYSLEGEFMPVALMAKTPFLLFSGPTSQASSVPRLIEYAKANPGKLTAANGDGTTMMASELFSSEAGITVLPVNYKGGSQMIADIVGGSVDFGFLGATAVMPLAKVGKLRILAVAGSARLAPRDRLVSARSARPFRAGLSAVGRTPAPAECMAGSQGRPQGRTPRPAAWP